MNNLLCFDLMEKIGQEVEIIRQTEKNKQKFKSSLNIILNIDPVYFYEDGEGRKDCPMFLCEIFNQDDY